MADKGKKYQTMSYAIIATAGVVAVLTLFAFSSFAQDDFTLPPFYEIPNVDECIRNKECVWYAFEKLVTKTENSENAKDGYISRRENDVSIKILGKRPAEMDSILHDVTAKLESYIPHKIEVKDPFNVLIIFSRDFGQSFIKNYAPLFKEMFGNNDFIMSFIEHIKNSREFSYCYGGNFLDEKNATATSIIIVRPYGRFFTKCLYAHLLLDLGLRGRIDNFFFTLNNTSDLIGGEQYGHPDEATNLDLFMLQILYHEKFTSGMPLSKVKDAFEEVYPETLEKWNSKKQE